MCVLEDTSDFGQGPFKVQQVLEHPDGNSSVKKIVRENRSGGVARGYFPVEAFGRGSFPGLQVAVYAHDVFRAELPGNLPEHVPVPAAHFQHHHAAVTD